MSVAGMRYAAIILLVGSSLAFAGESADTIRVQHETDLAACNRQFKAGKFKLRVEFQACLGKANAKVWAHTPHWDLFLTANARDFALAERFDMGGMTEAQYRALRAKIKSDLLTEVAQRDAYRAVTRPQQQGPIFCYTTGNITTCY